MKSVTKGYRPLHIRWPAPPPGGKWGSAMPEKFKALEIHKSRKPLEEIARLVNPMIRGKDNYFQKLREEQIRYVWNQLNHRLLKWVKYQRNPPAQIVTRMFQ